MAANLPPPGFFSDDHCVMSENPLAAGPGAPALGILRPEVHDNTLSGGGAVQIAFGVAPEDLTPQARQEAVVRFIYNGVEAFAGAVAPYEWREALRMTAFHVGAWRCDLHASPPTVVVRGEVIGSVHVRSGPAPIDTPIPLSSNSPAGSGVDAGLAPASLGPDAGLAPASLGPPPGPPPGPPGPPPASGSYGPSQGDIPVTARLSYDHDNCGTLTISLPGGDVLVSNDLPPGCRLFVGVKFCKITVLEAEVRDLSGGLTKVARG
jgi:hypothetical protein